MKKYLPLLIILFSCSRQNITPNSNGEPEISYDINGKHFAHTGEQTTQNGGIGTFASKTPGIGGTNTIYSFAGTLNNTNIIQLRILMPFPDTLKQITYHAVYGWAPIVIADGKNYSFSAGDDYLDITITDYKNGVVNGVFNGKMTNLISLNPLTIQPAILTNGVIKNVKIKY